MKRIVLFLRKRFLILVPILLAVLLWELLSLAAIFDPFLFPSFFPILERFFQLTVGLEILLDFASTIFKIVVALLVGSLGGLVIGVLLYKWNIIYDSVSPWLDFFRSIPATALFPLFLLFFGVGDSTNIALATWVCALYLSLHVSKGLRNANKTRLMVAKTLKKTSWETLWHVRFKEALPMVFLGFRTAVSLTVVLVIVTEMFIGTQQGLGKALIDASYVYDIPKLYAGIILVGLVGYLLNLFVSQSEKRFVHWHGK